MVVAQVDSPEVAGTLRVGDQILEFNDKPVTGSLFSVGVIVVEMITGRRPFKGRTYHEQLTAILHESFHLPVHTPEEQYLDAALQKSLAKDPKQRFASASAMRAELIPAIQSYKSPIRGSVERLEADTIIFEG